MEETFKIRDDKAADWAITQIHDAEIERDRLINLAEEQIKDLTARIDELKSKCDNETSFLRSCLAEYFQTIKPKETKTQQTYKLISGTLVLKKPSSKIVHNDDKLIEYLENNDGYDFIKIKKSVDWAEFKKNLKISDNGEVIDTDLGVVLASDICAVEDVPASFNIKY